MAISYRGGSFAKGTVTTLSPTTPAGLVAGDVLIGTVISDNNGNSVTFPSGWARFGFLTGPALPSHLELWYKVADGTEGASITVNFGGLSFYEVSITAYIGVHQTMPVSGRAFRNAQTDNALPTATASFTGSWAVALIADWNGLTPTNPDQGYTLAAGTPSTFDAMFVGYKSGLVASTVYGGEVFAGDTGSGALSALVILTPDTATVPDVIRYRSGSFAKGTTASLGVTAPSGIVSGDILLATLLVQDAAPTIGFPAGWTRLDTITTVHNANSITWQSWSKVADGTEGATITVTNTHTQFMEVGITAFDGENTTTPLIAHAIADSSADGLIPRALNTVIGATQVVAVMNWNGIVHPDPNGYYTLAAGTPSGADALYMGYRYRDGLDNSGGLYLGATATDGEVSVNILINPASGGGTTPISVSDSATGADSVSVLGLVTVADAGSGADAGAVAVAPAITDAGAATESLAFSTVAVAVADSALAGEGIGGLAADAGTPLAGPGLQGYSLIGPHDATLDILASGGGSQKLSS